MFQAGNPAWNLHVAYAHIPHNMSWQRLSLPKDAAYSITACADQARGALSIQKCPRRKKAEESQWFNTADIFFSFFCSPHVFKKCRILKQVHVCFFTTGGEKLILGRSRNIKKKKPQKESSLTSTARNRQQSGEHEGIFGVSPSPSHTHKHTLARSPTENLAVVPVSSRNKDTKFERRQLVVVVVLPVTYPTSPSVYLDQHFCLKNVT